MPKLFNQKLPSSSDADQENDFNKVEPNCRASGAIPRNDELVACGAMFEDFYTTLRPFNHFLDPQHLDANGNGKSLAFGSSAAEWALQDHWDQWPIEEYEDPQHFSYRDAEDYLWQALVYRTSNPAVDAGMRKQNWGLVFQSLGQIIHLIQDMASPQHTRNEPHYDKLDLGRFSQKSRYEQRALDGNVARWITSCLVVAPPASCKYGLTTTIQPVYPAFAAQFQQPRAFWENSNGSGLAQVTSRSFLSALRNFVEPVPGVYNPAFGYPLPKPTLVADVPLDELMRNAPDPPSQFVLTACNGNLATCKMRMIGTPISDPLGASPGFNDRASSESLFDADMKDYAASAWVYDPATDGQIEVATYSKPTINRFNIDRAYSLLIPRAVSYSAGFLNYYFRGSMSIKPPSSGIYSATDDSAFSPGSPTDAANGHRGFNTIRLRLANTTPAPNGSPLQKMTDGKIWAILKYQRNRCYTDDLTSQGADTKPLEQCLTDTEEIVVSDPIDRSGKGKEVVVQPSADQPEGEPLQFNFPSALPINAWNILLQVVFRGTLGAEENKIVVSTVDISEPTFVSIFNNTDYVYLGGSCYTPQQVKSDTTLWKRVSSACMGPEHAEDVLNQSCANAKYGLHLQDTITSPPHIVIANELGAKEDNRIPAKHFGRVALLADANADVDLSLQFYNPLLLVTDAEKSVHISPYHAHRSRVAPGTNTLDHMKTYRGVKAWNGFAFMMDVETLAITQDDGETCIGGAGTSLPELVDEARFPVPTPIFFPNG